MAVVRFQRARTGDSFQAGQGLVKVGRMNQTGCRILIETPEGNAFGVSLGQAMAVYYGGWRIALEKSTESQATFSVFFDSETKQYFAERRAREGDRSRSKLAGRSVIQQYLLKRGGKPAEQ